MEWADVAESDSCGETPHKAHQLLQHQLETTVPEDSQTWASEDETFFQDFKASKKAKVACEMTRVPLTSFAAGSIKPETAVVVMSKSEPPSPVAEDVGAKSEAAKVKSEKSEEDAPGPEVPAVAAPAEHHSSSSGPPGTGRKGRGMSDDQPRRSWAGRYPPRQLPSLRKYLEMRREEYASKPKVSTPPLFVNFMDLGERSWSGAYVQSMLDKPDEEWEAAVRASVLTS